MKQLLLAIALLCAGCTEQAVEKSFADPCLYCGKPYERVRCSQERDSASAIPVDKYKDAINFAVWCQKAHPDVWREYHRTVTGGE